ncbi:hypothetical protein PGT21_008296 [Puccinia graminis f. sp. tritici]|uniref:Uncharacterized protein n=1 Tax=Puccinia graminis f. sp. tritici TaxID=56615 RepID=A0A5B0RJS6_PUCGR|nr:hypothetical protein PGT21_008296 [Puccinia graminis f. sp. tritici]KAA1125235.1 hypothetical protein PGTUg99_010317 [Puccinia graminis f. sp. tritici]
MPTRTALLYLILSVSALVGLGSAAPSSTQDALDHSHAIMQAKRNELAVSDKNLIKSRDASSVANSGNPDNLPGRDPPKPPV